MIPPELESLVLRAVDESTGVMIMGMEGGWVQRVYTNQRAAEILGWPLEELAKKSPLEILAPEETGRIAKMIQAWHAGDPVPKAVETVYLSKDGRRVPVAATHCDLTHDGKTYSIAFYEDISERLRAQHALRASEIRFRQFTEASPDSITVVAGDRFVYANPASVRALGFDSMEELVARPLAELLDPDEMAIMRERMLRIEAGETLSPREYMARRKDGSKVALEISSITTELDGKPAIVAFGRDLSERKAMEAELVRSERMATIGMLAAGVAHEINNPLAYVMLNLERLQVRLPAMLDKSPEADRIRNLIDESIDGCERVASITRQLLLFSRPERTPSSVNAVDAVEAALKLAANPIRRTARVTKRIEATPSVCAEERRLTQVFLNLLLNATEAFGDRPAGDNEIEVAVRCDGDEAILEVSDNGPGIPTINLQRIFEPFFTTKPSGTGLGLAISRSIIESFGGRIEAVAREHGGTTFRVRLTRAAPSEKARRLPEEAAPLSLHRASIVVVDDEPLVAAALATMLRPMHEVSVFSNPREALARLLSTPAVDVVLCDLSMPELTGMELYARVCASCPAYASRFVFITGGATTPQAASFVADISARTLWKPFDTGAIQAAIRDCLSKQT
ncbi:MAG: PAS domain S-box protein [Polyangiaceae bacterium]|nr:PAS domain S-box protein [Polyangiaceae bacterium]